MNNNTSTSFRGSEVAAGVLRYAIAIFFAALILVPIAATINGGFKTNGELLTEPFSLTTEPQFTNYTSVLEGGTFWRLMANSLVIMLATAVFVVTLASMAAFVFARLQFPGRETMFNFFTIGLLFPASVAILPLYIVIRQAGLVDNRLGVIIPQVAFALPANILILRGFFTALPKELEDAASIDGCSAFGFFWRILIPLTRPALAAVIVLTMIVSWNGFFLPLLVLNSEELYTLPMGIMQFQGQFSTDWAKVLAFVSLAMVPAIIFYLLAERQIISGLTAGAVKG